MTERPESEQPRQEQPVHPGDGAEQSGASGQPDRSAQPGPQPEAAAPAPGGEPEDHAPSREGAAWAREEQQQPTPVDADAMEGELADARRALSELTTDLQRLQAEYLNYKRRVDRDRELIRENATFQVLGELLPVLDSIDRAREHGDLDPGFKAVADSLETVVTKLGLTKFGEKGDEFDPRFHEALMHGYSPDVTTTTVDVVAHSGYRIGERVVRAAKVTVLDPQS